MDLEPTELEGVFLIHPTVFEDQRGAFVKIFHAEQYQSAKLAFAPQEVFWSVSTRHVLRGLHFQVPPHAQTRVVQCLEGAVLDVVVDLRRGPSFGKVLSRELRGDVPELLFIPGGFAHGFVVLSERARMLYQASPVHAPLQDAGILWNSIDFAWPVRHPVLSDRDRAFPRLENFTSPF